MYTTGYDILLLKVVNKECRNYSDGLSALIYTSRDGMSEHCHTCVRQDSSDKINVISLTLTRQMLQHIKILATGQVTSVPTMHSMTQFLSAESTPTNIM